jgi:ubiquinone/menaquinone biosynthesis C-methylase UbiE
MPQSRSPRLAPIDPVAGPARPVRGRTWPGTVAVGLAAIVMATGVTCGAPAWGREPPLDAPPVEDRPEPAVPEAPATPTAPGAPKRAEPAVGPLPDRRHQGADPRAGAKVFVRPGQEVYDQRFRIVHAARPHLGMRVADIGAGTGQFAVLFARAVGPEGRVYALGSSESFVAGLRELARTYRVDNIVPMVGTRQGTGLPAGSIDLAFLSDSYHRLEQPRAMLDSIYQALVPYGSLIVVDFRREVGVGSPWVMSHVRQGRDQVVAAIQDAGFRLVEEPDFLRESYFLRFEKVGDEPDLEVGPIETDAPQPTH